MKNILGHSLKPWAIWQTLFERPLPSRGKFQYMKLLCIFLPSADFKRQHQRPPNFAI